MDRGDWACWGAETKLRYIQHAAYRSKPASEEVNRNWEVLRRREDELRQRSHKLEKRELSASSSSIHKLEGNYGPGSKRL